MAKSITFCQDIDKDYFQIQSPEELKTLRKEELPKLADSLRYDIIKHTSINGGHIGASLSCVDFIVAMHWVFETPQDSFIFDVGHQAYAHKMLTHRRFGFEKVRKEGGPSGFTNRTESDHDIFGAGHASTSISAALGILEGKSIAGKNGKVVAVVGDGALTGGLTFEGLNNAGAIQKNLIVIFNDNGMSIDDNVGALKDSFNNQDHVKDYFSVLGFEYWGIHDGHNIRDVIDLLENAKDHSGPVVIHVKTEKGHGYAPAVANKIRFHGCGPFEWKSGEAIQSPGSAKKYQDIFSETLVEIGKSDDKVVAITAGMPSGTSLKKFRDAHPTRFYDVGIAEAHAALFGAGLATQNDVKPFVCIYSTFLQRAYDQLIHDIALQNLPVRIAMDRGGLVGDDGATHQGVFDYAYFRSIPNFVVMAPKDEVELCHMIETMRTYSGPISVRFPRGASAGLELPQELRSLEIGKAEILYGDHSGDVLVLAIGNPVNEAVEAAKWLEAKEKLSVTVVNLRFAKPLDRDLIMKLAPEFSAVVTVEEGVRHGGVGSSILEMFADENLLVPTKVLGISDEFLDHASQKKQREIVGIDAKGIQKSCLEILEKVQGKDSKAPLEIVANQSAS